jgi:hypothetical protein
MVEKPNPLIIDPEKFVRTPLGTLEPNMAIAATSAKERAEKLRWQKIDFQKIDFSKIDFLVDGRNHLLSSQLDSQRCSCEV